MVQVVETCLTNEEVEALTKIGETKGRNLGGMVRESVQHFLEAKREAQEAGTAGGH